MVREEEARKMGEGRKKHSLSSIITTSSVVVPGPLVPSVIVPRPLVSSIIIPGPLIPSVIVSSVVV
jgi:hypothetical protein